MLTPHRHYSFQGRGHTSVSGMTLFYFVFTHDRTTLFVLGPRSSLAYTRLKTYRRPIASTTLAHRVRMNDNVPYMLL